MANQYLAIVIPFISAYHNPFLLLFTFVATLHLVVDFDGLHFWGTQGMPSKDIFYLILIALLCMGFVSNLWRNQMRDAFQWILHELKIQSGWQREF
jgi:hypothetical protein